MADIAGLLEVGPFTGDVPETFALRECCMCRECPACDGASPRAIYYDPGEDVSVCENCVQQYLEDAANA